jgi:hypothetical protein
MLGDLKQRRLRVALVFPEWDFGYTGVRVAEEQNPVWYQDFCAQHSPSKRTPRPRQRKKPDTFIKRAHTLRALDEIAGGRADSEYAQRLMSFVERVDKEIRKSGWMIE